MTAGLLGAIVVGAGVLYFVLSPLFRRDAAEAERISAAVSEERDLFSRREMLVAALKDLEDDRETGKVDDADYARLKNELSAEAVDIMKQLDALEEARQRSAPVAVPRVRDEATGQDA